MLVCVCSEVLKGKPYLLCTGMEGEVASDSRLSSGAAPASDAPGSWLAASSLTSQLDLTDMICELFSRFFHR